MSLEKTESELISKAKSGDPAAISKLYQMHARSLYRFIYYKVSNRQDAEDLTQDVFIAAFAGLPGFRGEAKFLNWCYEIAKRKIADLWKEKYQMPTVDIEVIVGLHTVDMTADALAERDAEDQGHVQAAETVLEKLNGNYRLVLEYRFLKNYSIKETAEAMNITVSNAKVLQHRALKKASRL